jgi:CRISPR-associated protein Csm1
VTENLGDWSDVRKRLAEEMRRLCGTPLAATGWMETESSGSPDDAYFAEVLGPALRDAAAIAWNPDRDQRIVPGEGKYAWALAAHGDGIALARHTALDDSGSGAASMDLLAARATGRKAWGVLRGDVDNFGVRIRRLTTIEEHIQISIMYKQFFAGEIEVLASMPEFWQRVSVLYTGGDDFAVYGSWDALIPFARELQRLFHRFAEENLKDFPGAEGKTITMAIALASGGESLAMVHEEAGQRLNAAKSSDKDSLWLLGRLIEWKQFGDASDLKDALTRMVTEHGLSPHYLREVCAIYRESQHRMSRRQARRTGERPWRYYRRIQRILTAAQEKEQSKGTAAREREFAKDCGSLIGSLVGHRGGYLKLRPAGRVALEWARLSTEG